MAYSLRIYEICKLCKNYINQKEASSYASNKSNLMEVSMTNLITTMKKEQEYLEQVKQQVEEDIRQEHKDKLPGKLRIQKKGNIVQYYHVKSEQVSQTNSEQKNQTYIPKKNITLARNLAQRDYDNKLLQEIDNRQKIVSKFLKEYPPTGIESTYEELNDYRKKLIHPIIETDESYAKAWMSAPYVRKIVGEDVYVIFTENGERVRSKSEKMIADKLRQLGIPYRYEAPLRLGRNCVLHLDFTLLHIKERKEIYYEHFGMMDNPEYVENALKRIELYEKNGIYPGDELLFSWETSTVPVNMKIVERMLKKFLL